MFIRNSFFVMVSILAIGMILAGCENTQEPTTELNVMQVVTQFDVPTGDNGPVTVDQSVTPCGVTHTVDLWAGQTIDAGSVTIYNDEVNLYVTVYSEFGYQAGDEQLKLWVGGDLKNLPRSPAGNPINGQFPYKITTDGGTTYTFTIPLDDLSLVNDCGDNIYVVLHADVLADDGNGGGPSAETAYGGDTGGDTGNSWWYYTTFTIQCCDDPPVFDHCETAFAYGTHVFTTSRRSNPDDLESLRLNRNRWGWAILLEEDGESTYDIWAGAGLNKTENGVLVGTLTITKSGVQVTVSYNLDEGYSMQELHIYAGDDAPTTIAPGQYGHTDYFDPMISTYSETFTVEDLNGGGVWIIAHAVVCW
jgi:hypothetical protein